ncbi:MAG TPA: trehalose-6-phosphate synthase, partial [Chloroflexi bacterium]|nr:trehalose-6-phosphate synthase [Chloroflexota bacterium]
MPEIEPDHLSQRKRKARLRQKVESLFDGRTLVLASNRGPITFERTATGSVRRRRGTGGVVSAVSAVSRYANPIWVCSPMSQVDREVAIENDEQPIALSTRDYDFRLRFVLTPQETYNDYYSVISNPLLWFIQHYMWDAPRSPTFDPAMWSAWDNYRQVNRMFAKAIAEEVERADQPAIILLQDYHLYLCPGELRDRLPENCLLSHFVHIPWPGPDYWMILPSQVRQEIFSSLCAVDLLGFHTKRYALNFLRTCHSLLPGAEVDYSTRTVRWRDRSVNVRNYPISVDLT